MKLLLYLIFFLIIILIYVLVKQSSKSILVTIISSLLIIQIVVDPKLCIESALLGVNLFVNKVFPSLFPFLVVTSIMMMYGGVQVYSKLLGNILCRPLRLPVQCTFALVVSMLCGYPLGAKYTCELYEQGLIDRDVSQRLLNIASNASPLFVIGAVGTSMLGSPYIGYLLLLSNYISCFIMGLLLTGKKSYTKQGFLPKNNNNYNIGSIVRDSIENSIRTCLSIGGFVILFCVLTNIIKSNITFDIALKILRNITGINSQLIEGTLLGLIEMTNGCYIMSKTSLTTATLTVVSFFLGFSGLSVISQVYSFTYKYDLSMETYIFRKFIQGLISAASMFILYKAAPVNQYIFTSNNQLTYINDSFMFFLIMVLLITPLFLSSLKNLFHTS